MVIAWLRSLLIFDGFLAPEGTVTVSTPEPAGEPWFRQLLALDGFIEAEREAQSKSLTSQSRVFQSYASTVSDKTLAPEIASSADEPEIYPHSEEALTDWQRILGWKE